MTATYRKRGATVRIERTSRGTSVVELSESGEAWFESGTFLARPSESGDRLRSFGSRGAVEFAAALEASVPTGFDIERFTLVQGAAEHRLDSRTWRERFARAHLSLVDRDRRLRMLFDLGGAAFQDVDLRVVAASRVSPSSSPVSRLHLPPHVTAALWAPLLEAAARGRYERRGFRIRQRPHPEFAIDGVGEPVVPAILLDAERPASADAWPNYYRPTYRTPPVRSPLHVAAESDGGRVDADAMAIALAEYPAVERHTVSAAVICQGVVHSLSMTANEWLRRIEWIGESSAWYPYAGGTWGADLVLRLDGLKQSEYRTSSSLDRA